MTVLRTQEQREREARAAKAPARVGRRGSAFSSAPVRLGSHRLHLEDGSAGSDGDELAGARQQLKPSLRNSTEAQQQQSAQLQGSGELDGVEPAAASHRLRFRSSSSPGGVLEKAVHLADTGEQGAGELAAARERLRRPPGASEWQSPSKRKGSGKSPGKAHGRRGGARAWLSGLAGGRKREESGDSERVGI